MNSAKNDIKEMRGALTPEEVLPDMMVVDVDSPEQYVEVQGLSVAQELNHLIGCESKAISEYEELLSCNLDLLSDKDIDKLKKIVSDKKANIAILQDMATTYDEIDVDKSATQSLKKLLKRSK